jgi:hypothetical protein
MIDIENMGQDSLSSLSQEHLSEEEKSGIEKNITRIAIALVFLVVGLLSSWIFPSKTTVPAFFYTVGFLIEGIPIVITAVKGIIAKDMEHAMEMLVAIAMGSMAPAQKEQLLSSSPPQMDSRIILSPMAERRTRAIQ